MMHKVLFILIGLISFNVFSYNILYDDDKFSLVDFNNEECHLLKIKNKKVNRFFILESIFTDSIDLSKENCFVSKENNSEKIIFYTSDSYDLNNGNLLRLNYDLSSKILVDNEYKNINFSRCAVINLEKSKVVGDFNAREHICTESNFHIYIGDN